MSALSTERVAEGGGSALAAVMDGLSEATIAALGSPHHLLIGDGWRPASTDGTVPVYEPSTGEVMTQLANASDDDVDAAVIEARRAFDAGSWNGRSPIEMTKVLLRLADLVDQHATMLSELEALDSGKPLAVAQVEVAQAADFVRYYAGWPTKIYGTVNPVGPAMHGYTMRAPIGVCAGIVPWNCPLINAAYKVAPALVCGNSVILKPAEQTSLTALVFGQLCLEAGVPPGVVQVLTGYGEEVGHALVVASRHRQDRLHRLHRDRPDHRPPSRRPAEEGESRVGRQEPRSHFRRRRSGGGGGARLLALRHLVQQRPDLRGRGPCPGGAHGVRRGRGGRGRA